MIMHNQTQHNATQHNIKKCVKQHISTWYYYGEGRYAEYRLCLVC
jgi:hypothetical protein